MTRSCKQIGKNNTETRGQVSRHVRHVSLHVYCVPPPSSPTAARISEKSTLCVLNHGPGPTCSIARQNHVGSVTFFCACALVQAYSATTCARKILELYFTYRCPHIFKSLAPLYFDKQYYQLQTSFVTSS